MDCGRWFSLHLAQTVSAGTSGVSMDEVNSALRHLFAVHMRLGKKTSPSWRCGGWDFMKCSCMFILCALLKFVIIKICDSLIPFIPAFFYLVWWHFLTLALSLQIYAGRFDPKSTFDSITLEAVNSPEHQQLAVEAAQQSMVLLKNSLPSAQFSSAPTAAATTTTDPSLVKPLLPYRRDLESIALVGPNADATITMLGNYHGRSTFITRCLCT